MKGKCRLNLCSGSGQVGPPFNPPRMLDVGAYSQHQQALSAICSEMITKRQPDTRQDILTEGGFY